MTPVVAVAGALGEGVGEVDAATKQMTCNRQHISTHLCCDDVTSLKAGAEHAMTVKSLTSDWYKERRDDHGRGC